MALVSAEVKGRDLYLVVRFGGRAHRVQVEPRQLYTLAGELAHKAIQAKARRLGHMDDVPPEVGQETVRSFLAVRRIAYDATEGREMEIQVNDNGVELHVKTTPKYVITVGRPFASELVRCITMGSIISELPDARRTLMGMSPQERHTILCELFDLINPVESSTGMEVDIEQTLKEYVKTKGKK